MTWTIDHLYQAEEAFKAELAKIPDQHREHVQLELTEFRRCLEVLVSSVGLLAASDDDLAL